MNGITLLRCSANSDTHNGLITLDDMSYVKKEDFNGLLDLVNNASEDAILA